MASALSTLERRGLVGEYTCTPAAFDRTSGARAVVAHLSEYALSPHEDQLPVLPVAVELYRHRPDPAPSALTVTAVESGWRLTVELGDRDGAGGLSTAPIRSG